MPEGRSFPRESEGSPAAVLPDYDPSAALVRDPARPNPAELTRCRLQAISLIGAVLRGDFASVFQLAPKSVSDAGYLTTALAEVAADLIRATGRDPAEVVDELRGSAIRHQATGGRPDSPGVPTAANSDRLLLLGKKGGSGTCDPGGAPGVALPAGSGVDPVGGA
jgi:hypothetical protein